MREYVLDYLIKSKFIENYTKKLIFPSDIDNYYDDFVQEVWLAICEVGEDKWLELYNKRPNHDEFYDIRNWISVLIRNTVRSTTSTAYRKLKKQSTITQQCNEEEWKFLSNTIPDGTTITQSIINQQ